MKHIKRTTVNAIAATVVAVLAIAVAFGGQTARAASDRCYSPKDAEMIAKTVWGEARGLNQTEQAAVIWCVLNRVDDSMFPNTIKDVITQRWQFLGYRESNPVDEDILALTYDVLARWLIEPRCIGSVGRVLPKEYFWFHGDGKHNYFRDSYRGGNRWDWSLDSPYEEAEDA